ncbi:MAG: efflux RND transporter permease subunit [Rhodospirillaceae bacterium]|jgi:multidrug efflux pump|nr:efflux RND transporter permease subunit [Rhodospirillaceae bacterium]MBT5244573.1 efflux RND transporter permease subunit [Rhodospirillaceae bacterium]MBT5563483.1 efflux RND transporter permease subunit [Rhodospirillaceae bacterium]MBT6240786.1 efflux RND transporter permease subunit [Rhodospirillaceae bacterium]MBT7137792.1 efflux RND transporter permease subunit [Rhodospirillaceae bacterium]
MNAIIDAAVTHSRTVLAALVLILITGTKAYIDVPKEADPDINIPIVYVQMDHEGISPEDAERLLIRPMEQELRGIEGVKEMSATGYEGGASVTLEFDAGFDSDKAMSDVREKVDLAKSDLPDETEDPTVHEVNFSLFPVILVTLAGEVPERTLLRLARDLKDEVEAIATVLEVKIAGEREEMVEVLIDPVRVESYGLSPEQAVQLVAASNLLVAAGAQDTGHGRFSLKVPGLLETTKDIMGLPIRTDGDAVISFSDIAEIRRTFKDAESFARYDGRQALVLEVTKRTGENIIDTIENVRRVVRLARADWPEPLRNAVKVGFAQDKSKDIRIMLNDLQNNVISAVLLVMVVVIAALGLRTAGLVGIAIPGSFLTGILVLTSFGMTINIVVLFGLILAVGMLVDGAIVVTEFADRKMIEGEPRRIAYALAAKRMSWPIIASTATTLAAFLPLVFWPGVVGEFMKFLPLTLLATLSASLLMALIFVPTLGAFIGKPGNADHDKMTLLAGSEHHDPEETGGFTGGYIHILKMALNHPAKILMAALVLLVGVQVIYGTFGKGIEFFPEVEPDFAKIQVRARGNLSVYEMDRLMGEVESRVLEIGKEKGEFEGVYLRTGKEQNSQEAEDIIGIISLQFNDWQHRRKADQILDEIEDRTADLVGIIIDRRKQESGPPVGKPVAIELSSRFPELLSPAVETVLQGFHSIEGLINIEDSRPLPGIDWELRVDRAQAMKFNASVDVVGRAIKMASTGIRLGGYRPNDADEEIDIQARYPVQYRTINQLDHIRINTESGRVPISNFVKRIARPKTGTVQRTDARRVMTVKSDVVDGMLPADKVQELQSWLENAQLDPRVEIAFKGEDEEQRQAQAFLGKAFMVALFIMAIILVTQFNSFYSALLILTAVIMSTIGVFIGLLVTGQPFGIIMSGVGVIALAGIVVNNNIVLIDTYDRLKETAENAREAILRTGAQRLRPVLLTTITTMLGLMPMVTGVNIDFIARDVSIGAPSMQWWSQLSTAIVFGLGFATVLTLVVTPCALMIKDNVHGWLERRRQDKAVPSKV